MQAQFTIVTPTRINAPQLLAAMQQMARNPPSPMNTTQPADAPSMKASAAMKNGAAMMATVGSLFPTLVNTLEHFSDRSADAFRARRGDLIDRIPADNPNADDHAEDESDKDRHNTEQPITWLPSRFSTEHIAQDRLPISVSFV